MDRPGSGRQLMRLRGWAQRRSRQLVRERGRALRQDWEQVASILTHGSRCTGIHREAAEEFIDNNCSLLAGWSLLPDRSDHLIGAFAAGQRL